MRKFEDFFASPVCIRWWEHCNKNKVCSSCCRWRRYGRTTKELDGKWLQEGVQRMMVMLESDSRNESFARVCVASFMTRMNPTVAETDDVKTGSIRGGDKFYCAWLSL